MDNRKSNWMRWRKIKQMSRKVAGEMAGKIITWLDDKKIVDEMAGD